ncbi:uncharacterized protein JCM10292_004693 [Rhodotorula paludigena]|uniref:uncharacterized protein n=1 Tax=Rhodotorula paludigena TaxID=86838 RepID=UPI00317240FE
MAVEGWLSLVRQATAELDKSTTELELEVTDSLLALFGTAKVPSPLVIEYLRAALRSDYAGHITRPGYTAYAATLRTDLSLPAAEAIFSGVLEALNASPKAPCHSASNGEQTAQGLVTALGRIVPLILSNPSSTSSTAIWLARFVTEPPHRLAKGSVDEVLLEQCAAALRERVEELAQARGVSAGRDEAKLQAAMQSALARLSAKGRRRMPAPVNLDLVCRGAVGPDLILLVSDLVMHPYIPTRHITSRLAALLAYRVAQAPFRSSTTHEALSSTLAEFIRACVQLVQGANREDVVLESWLFAKLPRVLQQVQSAPGLQQLHDPLVSAMRALQGDEQESSKGMQVEGATSTFDSFIAALCQHELLSPDEGAEISRQLDTSDVQPFMAADYSDRLSGASPDDVKHLLEELLGSYALQQPIAKAIVESFASQAQSNDLPGLAFACDVLVEHRDALAVLLLHIEPVELLSPVRELLDSVDTSQDSFGDSNPIERYGSLVLFLEIVVHRFKLHDNLARHLGQSTSFFVSWLPASSAVFALPTLSDDERSTISGWIGALFGEGISDDLMHATNPRTLLRVAPTILKQSLRACQAGVVDLDNLRDALSYFLQELLRFTLPGVLLWLIEKLGRTPPSTQQTAMLDLLQTLVTSDSLPPPVLELVAPELARYLLDSAAPTQPLDRVRILKLIAPFRPVEPALVWPDVVAPTPADQLRVALAEVCAPPSSSARTQPANLASVTSAALDQSLSPAAFLRNTLLPLFFSLLPSAIGDAVSMQRTYSNLEGAGAALLALPLDATNRQPLLETFVSQVLLLDLPSWLAQLHGDTGVGSEAGGARERLELLGDITAGAFVIALSQAEQAAETLLDLLAKGVEHAGRASAQKQDGQSEEDTATPLSIFVDRIVSWSVLVDRSPRLAALAQK